MQSATISASEFKALNDLSGAKRRDRESSIGDGTWETVLTRQLTAASRLNNEPDDLNSPWGSCDMVEGDRMLECPLSCEVEKLRSLGGVARRLPAGQLGVVKPLLEPQSGVWLDIWRSKYFR